MSQAKEGRAEASQALALWVLGLAAALAVAGLVVVWSPPVLPGLDTPLNLTASWIAAHAQSYRPWFEPNLPFTVLVHRGVLTAAFAVASPFRALGLARSAELAVMLAGALVLVRRAEPGRSPALVVLPLSAAACFGWFHLMGYLNFTFAVALLPLALAFVREKPGPRDGLWLGLVGFIITETHAFVGGGLAAILAVAALCHRFVDRSSRAPARSSEKGPDQVFASWPASARNALMATAPSFAVLALTVLTAVGNQPEFETRGARPTTLLQDLTALPHTVFGGYSPLGWPLAAIAVTAAGAGLWSERRARSLRWWVALWSLASLVLYFVAPLDGFGWLFLKPRFTPFPFLVAALLAHPPRKVARPLGALAVAVTAAHLAFYGVRSTAAGRKTAETVAAFGHDPPGVLLPLVFEGHDGQEPPQNLGTLTYAYAYTLLDGPGAAPMLFAHNPSLHHSILAEGARERLPDRPSPWAYRWLSRAELADVGALSACRADSVALIGALPEDRARLEARGIHFTSPALGHPRCARGKLGVQRAASAEVPPRAPAPIRVRVGIAQTDAWIVDALLDGPGATLEIQLPAGEVDLVACPADPGPCAPGRRALAERKLVLAEAGSFDEVLHVP